MSGLIITFVVILGFMVLAMVSSITTQHFEDKALQSDINSVTIDSLNGE